MRDAFDPNKTVWEEISEGKDVISKREVPSGICRLVQFAGPAGKSACYLAVSARVHLAKMLKEGNNLLLLDEPTNDLDTETLSALESRWRISPAARSSSRMTACSSTVSRRTSSRSRATATSSGSRATLRPTRKTRSAASATPQSSRTGSSSSGSSGRKSLPPGSAPAGAGTCFLSACSGLISAGEAVWQVTRIPSHRHVHMDAAAGDRRVFLAVVVNVGLTVGQIIGGLLAGSLALIADAVHNFSDAISLGIAFFARKIARRQSDERMTFGYVRAELVAALINYTTLIAIGVYLAYEAILRFFSPEEVEGWLVVAVAGLALVIDAVTALLTYSWPRRVRTFARRSFTMSPMPRFDRCDHRRRADPDFRLAHRRSDRDADNRRHHSLDGIRGGRQRCAHSRAAFRPRSTSRSL